MDPAKATIAVAIIGALVTIVTLVLTDRRERVKATETAVEKVESEMVGILRERLKLRDEQIEALMRERDALKALIDGKVGNSS
jgi:uncharacterized protein YoxC